MAKSTEEQIFIGIDDERIELVGKEKAAFLAQRETVRLEEEEFRFRQEARKNALTKLAEAAGLTKEELASIL